VTRVLPYDVNTFLLYLCINSTKSRLAVVQIDHTWVTRGVRMAAVAAVSIQYNISVCTDSSWHGCGVLTGVAVNYHNSVGCSALFAAVHKSHSAAVDILLRNGANPNL